MTGGGPSTRRRVIWWTLATALAAAAGTFGFVASSSNADEARRAQAEATSVRIIQLRSLLRRTHLDEVDLRALEVFDMASSSDVSSAESLREGTRAMAIGELADIAQGSGANAIEAGALVSMLTEDEVVDGAVEPLTLFEAGRAAGRDVRPVSGELPTGVEQLYDVMRLDSIGHQILNDGLDANYVLLHPDVPSLMADYFSESGPYLASDGGYLGPDPNQPLIDGFVWYPTTDAPHPLYDRISDLVRSSGLWEYDQWIVSWQDGEPGAAPLTLDELVSVATTVDSATRVLVDEALMSARADALDEASEARTRERLWMVATLVIVVALLAAGGVAISAYVRRLRERHRLASLDPLTGAGTRHLLDERTATLLADPVYASHLVAVIDMDRFKLINDTWGHTIGDLVLVEVAKRLQQISDDICLRRPGTVSTLVRLGGDEFLLSLHSRGLLDEDDLRLRLEDARRASILARDGERVDLSFSIGITTLAGPGVLTQAMDAADLATYEDKAMRGVGGAPATDSRGVRARPADAFDRPDDQM